MGHDAAPHVQPLIENLFRRESGRLTASLTRFFGSRHLELAEDVVQDTLIKAMREWPYKGIPDDPVAWLHRVARNGVVDKLRRDSRGIELMKENAALLRSEWTLSSTVGEALDPHALKDDQLRMMFACCHPSLPPEQQVALALKTLCGFSVPEIARAFLTNEESINKRLYRARDAFRQLGELEIPAEHELPERLEQVLSVIYLLFNEGYHSVSHHEVIREDLIEEALRLTRMLLDHEATTRPQVHALLALMCFHASRTGARRDQDGSILLLQDQDRATWDRALIALGNEHLSLAADGQALTSYHVEAAIASFHANATSYEATDWAAILGMYDQLILVKPSPLVALNRAVAVAERDGAAAGLIVLDKIEGLQQKHLYHAVQGEFFIRLGRRAEANTALSQAIRLATSLAERELLTRKLRLLEKTAP